MFRVAILDMNNNEPNQGLRCIKEIVKNFPEPFDWQVFDVRFKCEIPDTSFDIYISSGGPGDPLEGDGIWDKQYFELMDALWAHNQSGEERKKYAFFICHSFQMIVHHFKIGIVTPRKSMSFGIFPVHKTEYGEDESFFQELPDPFWTADFRRFQIVDLNVEETENRGAKILALEKIRPHVELDRAIMAVRFSEEFFGTQFHPEADSDGMIERFMEEERRLHVIETYDEDKYRRMIEDMYHPERLSKTHDTILPNFLKFAVNQLHLTEIF